MNQGSIEKWNIGHSLFTRGALMAEEMVEAIRQATQEKISFKDDLRGLLEWTQSHQRAFAYDEMAPILSKSTGIDLSTLGLKWQNE